MNIICTEPNAIERHLFPLNFYVESSLNRQNIDIGYLYYCSLVPDLTPTMLFCWFVYPKTRQCQTSKDIAKKERYINLLVGPTEHCILLSFLEALNPTQALPSTARGMTPSSSYMLS